MPFNLFDSLADELVLDILNYLLAIFAASNNSNPSPFSPDLWHISRCNKRLRRITLPLLYHTIIFTMPRFFNPFLELVIRNPLYASQVQSLTIDWYTYWIEWDQYEQNPTVTFLQVGDTHNLPLDFLSGMHDRGTWTHGLLFLHLLRNLEVLSIRLSTWQSDLDFGRYLHQFFQQGLTSTKLRSLSWDPYRSLDINNLIPALLFSSITEIQTSGLYLSKVMSDSQSTPQATDRTRWYGTSGVQELRLHRTEIEEECLCELLRLPRALKNLVYSPQDIYRPINLDRFKEILDYVSHSIELLDISWEQNIRYWGRPVFWSFRNFTLLRILLIDYRLVCGYESSATDCIADSLPPTLETLAMRIGSGYEWSNQAYIDKGRNILAKKSALCLIRLRMVAHLDYPILLEPLEELASSRNVKIALDRRDLQLWQ
jgi:hypothetical protein